MVRYNQAPQEAGAEGALVWKQRSLEDEKVGRLEGKKQRSGADEKVRR